MILNNPFFKILKWTLRVYAVASIYLIATIILDVMRPERDITVRTVGTSIAFGIVATAPFILATLRLRKRITFFIGCLLIPSIMISMGLIQIQFGIDWLSIGWGCVLTGLSFLQLLNKGDVCNEKAN